VYHQKRERKLDADLPDEPDKEVDGDEAVFGVHYKQPGW
jgi:hypothetical protein